MLAARQVASAWPHPIADAQRAEDPALPRDPVLFPSPTLSETKVENPEQQGE